MKFLNETRINHHGHEYTVIGYNPANKRYTVHFPHNNVTKAVSVQSIRSDIVSEKPAHTKATKSFNARTAQLFRAMHNRLETLPTYRDVEIDIRWETLAGFRDSLHQVPGFDLWLEWTGFSLDKDQSGQNTYGPDTCKFVSVSENASQPRKRTEHMTYPIGTMMVSKHGQPYKVIGKDRIWTIIKFLETGEVRQVPTHSISVDSIGVSPRGE